MITLTINGCLSRSQYISFLCALELHHVDFKDLFWLLWKRKPLDLAEKKGNQKYWEINFNIVDFGLMNRCVEIKYKNGITSQLHILPWLSEVVEISSMILTFKHINGPPK